MQADPGLEGVVPFRFACHRCGHCCTAGSGHVWLREGELDRMARALDMTPAAFGERYVRQVPDPRTGELRSALRERAAAGPGSSGDAGGACALLEGQKHCTVYTDRPQHCREFPYWPSVLEDELGFEAARAVCPGIAVEPSAVARERAFALLEALYEELEAFVQKVNPVCLRRGVCCNFEQAGHELFSTALEADYAAARHPHADPPAAAGRCPYHVQGMCTAREGRPLGCRTYFCDSRWESVLQEAHEHFLGRLRSIERDTGYPVAYARFPALLEARGIGLADGAGASDAEPAS
ncbi:MAG: Fe-S-cluster containining protein [Chlamydiales bacterium]